MSWIKENKFLAGFTAFTVVGAGALSFLTLQAKGKYDTAVASFEEQSAKLNSLQNSQPFPSAANVKKLQEQKAEFQEKVAELQQKLAKVELPIEQISPQQFQDRLRQTVDSINQKAAASYVELPQNFSLGFDRYLAEPPRPEAAGLLGRQLKAIEAVVTNLIDSRINKLSDLKRQELPEEKAGTREPEPTKGAKGSTKSTAAPLVEKHPFDITFTSTQGSIMKVLNSIVASKTQFYIPRVITVKNEKETGPSRVDPAAAIPSPAAPVIDPAAAPSPELPGSAPAAPTVAMSNVPGQSASPYIVGEEKAEVTMRIEIVDFADKATAAK